MILTNDDVNLQIMWRKVGDLHPLTIDQSTFVSDSRISVNVDERRREWQLVIDDVKQTDDGVYNCQVNTKDDQSNFYSFYVQVKSMFPGLNKHYILLPAPKIIFLIWLFG